MFIAITRTHSINKPHTNDNYITNLISLSLSLSLFYLSHSDVDRER